MSRYLIAAILCLGLAACEGNMSDYDYSLKHPIKVETRTALLILEPGPGGRVNAADMPAIDEFSRDFCNKAAGGITIRFGAATTSDPLEEVWPAVATNTLPGFKSR